MVIGNGLLAKTFKKYNNINDIIIFASGVSNSKEIDDHEFDREFNLLKSVLDFGKTKKLIYFSTCSIIDVSLKNSKYVKHKNDIENYIKINFNKYLIFRLPNIVSDNKNLNTSFNFFKNKIMNQEEIICDKYATRYFIDIDDLKETLPIFIDTDDYTNQTIDITFNNKETVNSFIIKMGKIINLVPKITLINTGVDYTIDNSIFINKLKEINYFIKEDYNQHIIKKYI
jgi:hypothetical protein